MKHPFWIVNSTLLGLFILAISVVYFTQVTTPERESIETHTDKKIKQEQSIDIDIKKIYENDLFDTYQKNTILPLYNPSYAHPLPEPPMPHDVPKPIMPKPQFLEPLNIVLKGIVVINNSDASSSAILEDKNSGKEHNYVIGDMVEDARLVRVFPTKIVFLRANGQQEIIYLNEDDATNDHSFAPLQDWDKVIQKINRDHYIIDPQEFVARITSLAQWIDTIGLVTAYKKGTSVGCRIGKIMDQSLSENLGLKTGDIILSVNNISTATTLDRLRIYKMIIALKEGESFSYVLQRKTDQLTVTITLQHIKKNKTDAVIEDEKINETEQLNALLQRKKLAPTLKEIEKQERQNMMRFGAPLSNHENNNDK